jgi:ectoine hydroxylase-related dioxygenase (phytanoyl-CoA dioxygenase family)
MPYQTIDRFESFDPDRFAAEGIVVVRELARSRVFASAQRDLAWCARALLQKRGDDVSPSARLEEVLYRLYQHDNLATRTICHLGTQPNKLVSANCLKYSPDILAAVRRLFPADAVIGTPAASDTLHVFMPDPKFAKYILPMHQDYPYLMQSEAQLTAWIPFSPPSPGVGGLNVWLGSHRLGVCASKKNEYEHYAAVVDEGRLAGYPKVEVDWNEGDLVLMDSLLLHQGVPNTSADHRVRVVQLFRYTNLAHLSARDLEWASAYYPRTGVRFEERFPDLFEG